MSCKADGRLNYGVASLRLVLTPLVVLSPAGRPSRRLDCFACQGQTPSSTLLVQCGIGTGVVRAKVRILRLRHMLNTRTSYEVIYEVRSTRMHLLL